MYNVREASRHPSIYYALSRIAGAKAWSIEVRDQMGERQSSLGRSGDIEAIFPAFWQEIANLQSRAESGRKSVVWVRAHAGNGEGTREANAMPSLLLFVFPVPTGDSLMGGLVCEPQDLAASAFRNEDELLGFLAGLAVSVSSERRIADERLAMRRLLSSLAVKSIVFDRAGRVLFESFGAAGAPTSRGIPKQCETSPFRELAKRVLAGYRSNPKLFGRSCYGATLDLGQDNPLPIYILPLSGDPSGEVPEFLAIIQPCASEPPGEEALAAALALTLAEAKVVRHVLLGKRVRNIARETSLTEQTVRTYLKRTYAKLGVSSQAELISKALQNSVPLMKGIDSLYVDFRGGNASPRGPREQLVRRK